MDVSRKLGILVFCGVPAIVGGGIVSALFGGSLVAVAIYEAILIGIIGSIVGTIIKMFRVMSSAG